MNTNLLSESKNENESKKSITNISDEEKSIIDWNNYLKRNQSILVDLFYGQYKSAVICPFCEYKTINFNTFLNIELPIPIDKNFICYSVLFHDYDGISPLIPI